MGGIFGYYIRNNGRELVNALINNIDKTRGHMLRIFGDPQGGIIIQGYSLESFLIFNDGKLTLVLFTDSPSQVDLDEIKLAYTKNDLPRLFRTLNDITVDYVLGIYDALKKRIVIACDGAGIRKIYYSTVNGNIIFSSSLRQLIKTLREASTLNKNIWEAIDTVALRVFLAYGISPVNRTLIKSIRKLSQGLLIISRTDLMVKSFTIVPKFMASSEKELVRNIYNLLVTSIKTRVEKSGIQGVLLSGGVDSSLIASILSRVYPPDRVVALNLSYDLYSEADKAREVADYLGIRLIEVKLPQSFDQRYRIFKESIAFLDEPNVRGSFLLRYFALKALREYGDVVFLGEGGDEIFLGYWKSYWNWYSSLRSLLLRGCPKTLYDITLKLIKTSRFNEIVRNYIDVVEHIKDVNTAIMIYFSIHKPALLKEFFPNNNTMDFLDPDLLSKIELQPDVPRKTSLLLLNFLTHSDVLTDENICSRLGMKLKLPFLDLKIIRYAMGIDPKYNIRGNTTKYLLRKIAEDEKLLPKKLIFQEKLGFTSRYIFDNDSLSTICRETLNSLERFPNRELLLRMCSTQEYYLLMYVLALINWVESLGRDDW